MTWFERLGRRIDAGSEALASHPCRVIAVIAVILAAQISPLWYSTPDGCSYLSMGRSFWTAGGPLSLGHPYKSYAAGYSLILSPLFWTADRPFVLIGIVHLALAILTALGIYRWAKAFGPAAGLYAVAFTLLHACYGLYYRRTVSETAFMAGMYWTAVVLDRVRTATNERERLRFVFLGTVMLLATCQLRPNGLMLAPGFAAALIWAGWCRNLRLRRAVVISLTVGSLAAIVFITMRRLDDRWADDRRDVTHWQFMQSSDGVQHTLVERAFDGMKLQAVEFLRVSVPGALKTDAHHGWWHPITLVSLACTAAAVVGWLLLLRRRADVLLCSMPFYLLLNIVWATDQGGRYTLPLLPVIALGWWSLVERMGAKPQRILWPLLAVHLVVATTYWATIDLPRARVDNSHWPDLDAVAAEISTDRDGVAVFGLGAGENLLRVSLDRTTRNWHTLREPLRNDILWIVAGPGIEPPTGFSLTREIGSYRLFRRDAK